MSAARVGVKIKKTGNLMFIFLLGIYYSNKYIKTLAYLRTFSRDLFAKFRFKRSQRPAPFHKESNLLKGYQLMT